MELRSVVMKADNLYGKRTVPTICFVLCICFSVFSQNPDTTAGTAQQGVSGRCRHYPLFQPGDAIQVLVYPDTGLFINGTYVIDGNGCVDLPVIGLMDITGKAEIQVQKMLEDAYIDYLRYPNIQVRPLIRASVLGGFHTPGLYYVDPRASMWNLFHMGGGTLREDGIEKSRWERDGKVYKENVIPYYQSGESLRDIGFKSGDQISVTPRPVTRGWDIFVRDILPVLSFAITASTATITTILLYREYDNGS
ncbi:MAG: hypothetical protein GF401_04835 [Chitinivibrionales bacterium]|nr:hypothetical protein [Chitinivibrionales bacterium]